MKELVFTILWMASGVVSILGVSHYMNKPTPLYVIPVAMVMGPTIPVFMGAVIFISNLDTCVYNCGGDE